MSIGGLEKRGQEKNSKDKSQIASRVFIKMSALEEEPYDNPISKLRSQQINQI